MTSVTSVLLPIQELRRWWGAVPVPSRNPQHRCTPRVLRVAVAELSARACWHQPGPSLAVCLSLSWEGCRWWRFPLELPACPMLPFYQRPTFLGHF